MRQNVLIILVFPFLHFPWVSFSHRTWQQGNALTHHHSRICLYHRGGRAHPLVLFVHGVGIQQHLLLGGTRRHVMRGTGKGHLCGIPFKPILPSVKVGKAKSFPLFPTPLIL
ncbi:uncharacterized protein TM35_000023980 [Trypanosoma theileri]|uniref:Secreted protein n=1 Tax=Trypanosoma theileri TaxID=67003 RepID=A0A1X0P818_9TRYP|nr:uncharacterized protein TM35_000023980 [Trypanosoma theileri]ORC93072.1 hypothetical protein TM35_000023980 [Trypanosoma theileri]